MQTRVHTFCGNYLHANAQLLNVANMTHLNNYGLPHTFICIQVYEVSLSSTKVRLKNFIRLLFGQIIANIMTRALFVGALRIIYSHIHVP